MNKLKKKKIIKRITNMYKTVDEINNRLDVLINIELNRDFNTEEEFEFVELKRLRFKLNQDYPFFGS